MAWYSKAGFIRKAFMYAIGIVMTSVIAGTMTGFFSLYHFQQFAVYGVLSNMLAVPLTGVIIMPAAILTLLLMPFGIAGIAIKAMEWGCVWMLAIAHWTAGLSGAVIHVTQWPEVTFVFVVVGMILFLLWSGWRGKGVAAFLMVIGLAFAPYKVQPDIMVSDSGKLVAVRDGENVYFSSRRKDKFTAENWLRLLGRDGEKPVTFKDKGSPVMCDEEGCRVTVAGQNVSLVYSRAAFYEDWDWADVLIADIPLPRVEPEGRVVLGLYDFLDNGSHAIYLGKTMRVRNVKDEMGDRPWSE
jgi:competence protein ComEC